MSNAISIKPCEQFRPESHFELTQEGDVFRVWVFDHAIGEGHSIEAAMDDAHRAIRRWVDGE
jgi:hypothetical protein